ncbi:hypothetical protein F3Y22_tig00003715pilonHSYRG00059 [Hibiscus syriacus]|uniref:DUF4283 domain-containing protein n=1 Tax=Hibiscus syriacus TaxID=106335 RepID=A0A6A3CP95_HIBSY|nr:hypothetical protein F3Y22_tig00003715pilonHSYRG00059 [Hibiscus syriacus]
MPSKGNESYASITTSGDRSTACLSPSWIEEVIIDKDALVDKSGPFPYHTRIQALWKLVGEIQLIDLDNAYFIVKFTDERDYTKILTEGPWTIYGRYLTVQLWSKSFSTFEKYPSHAIVWVRLPGLPYRYYYKALFRRLVNHVGRVVKVDYNTQAGERGKFARLVTLVDLNKPLLSCIGSRFRVLNKLQDNRVEESTLKSKGTATSFAGSIHNTTIVPMFEGQPAQVIVHDPATNKDHLKDSHDAVRIVEKARKSNESKTRARPALGALVPNIAAHNVPNETARRSCLGDPPDDEQAMRMEECSEQEEMVDCSSMMELVDDIVRQGPKATEIL